MLRRRVLHPAAPPSIDAFSPSAAGTRGRARRQGGATAPLASSSASAPLLPDGTGDAAGKQTKKKKKQQKSDGDGDAPAVDSSGAEAARSQVRALCVRGRACGRMLCGTRHF